MRDKETYIYLDKIGEHNFKVSLPVLEDMYKSNIGKDYLLDILNNIEIRELDNLEVGEEFAISDEDKDFLIILSVKKEFLALDYIIPGEKISE